MCAKKSIETLLVGFVSNVGMRLLVDQVNGDRFGI